LILCGAGNNAGDGYVVARLASQAGVHVTVAGLADPHRLKGDAATAWQDFKKAGGAVVQFSEGLCGEADLILDALVGTGLQRALDGAYLHAVESVNAAGSPVIAVDIPAGLNGATGQVMGGAIRADLTVTFIGRKLGVYLGAGPEHAGETMFADLGVPLEAVSHVTPRLRLFDETDLARLLPVRPRTAHKGHFGHVLVVGGNQGMGGAVRLAGEAALRAGAGLVSVATRPENVVAVTGYRPELMARGATQAADLDVLLERATVIAIGPGLGQDAWARDLLQKVLQASQPKVLDADALNLLSERPGKSNHWILTPHPGEAGRLLQRPSTEVQGDRLAAVTALAERYGGVALLKGACTLVAHPDSLPYVIDRGNPGMASGGMGDVLTGLVAGILAQRRATEALQVAAAAAFVHACAADAAARDGERGLIAGDLFPHLRAWLNPRG
jgi:NAD(P)H-hydrate epimerase